MDELTPTSETSLAISPASDAAPAAVATSGDDGVGQLAQEALDQSTAAPAVADPIGEVLASIPEADTDLETVQDQQLRERLTGMRGQLRVLGSAIKELTPLRAFQEFGDPAAVKPRLEIGKLLYSPVLDPRGNPVRDSATQLALTTTRPLWEHLDKVSPGMTEQAFVDLVNFQPTSEDGRTKEAKLGDQYLAFLKLDPSRLSEYRNIDALIARNSGTITPEELAEIPAEYHAAYRTIPPSIRAGWKGYDEADQTRMLEDYKGKLDDAVSKEQSRKDSLEAKARSEAEYANKVADATRSFYQTVRRERYTALNKSLAEQVTFSADPITNQVMRGSLCSTLALLLDPEWRFITVEEVLTPLGFKLDSSFDAVLTKFDAAANSKVALEMAGDTGQAAVHSGDAQSAVNQLMAKIAPMALKIALRQGATMTEKAQAQAQALAAAASARPNAGNGGGTVQTDSILPPGMQPGSREAAEFIARQTKLFTDVAR